MLNKIQLAMLVGIALQIIKSLVWNDLDVSESLVNMIVEIIVQLVPIIGAGVAAYAMPESRAKLAKLKTRA